MSDKRQRIANILDELDTEPDEPILSRAVPRGTVRGPTETENPIESTADQAFNMMFGWMNVGSDAGKATATEMDDIDMWALWRNPTTKAQREMLETRLAPWLTAHVLIGRGYLLPAYVKTVKMPVRVASRLSKRAVKMRVAGILLDNTPRTPQPIRSMELRVAGGAVWDIDGLEW